MGGAELLRGDPVVQDIEDWCLEKGHKHGREPVLAVVFFNMDQDAVDYVRIKAHVAKRARVGYWVYETPVDSPSSSVQSLIRRLNRDSRVHGILVQRPVPEHMDELKIMATISPRKHIEEYSEGKNSNIAADAMARLLDKHGLHGLALRDGVHVAGWGNIITDGFVAHLRREYPRVNVSPGLKLQQQEQPSSAVVLQSGLSNQLATQSTESAQSTGTGAVLVSELHCGPGYITERNLDRSVQVIIDLGFFATEKGIGGDVDPDLFERGDLAIAPTPGGMLPILLWLMMERTIRSDRMESHREASWCLCQ